MSHEGLDSSYTIFKEKFYGRVQSGEILNCHDFNLLKVVLDGLKVNYIKRGKINSVFKRSALYFLVYLVFRYLRDFRLRKKWNSKQRIFSKKILVGFSGRHISEGDRHYPFDFQRIFNEFGRNNFNYIAEDPKYSSDDMGYDCHVNDIPTVQSLSLFRYLPLYAGIKKTIQNVFRKIPFTDSEQENIWIACHIFILNYIKWSVFLDKSSFKILLIQQHYHREALLYACRKRKIPVVELQHGLISEVDIFYVFPIYLKNIIDKALFPNEILVYGSHWKNTLLKGCEFTPERITILGYHQYVPQDLLENGLQEIIGNRKVILITTQFSSHDYYINYAREVCKKIPEDWLLIIKPHPNEDVSLYKSLKSNKNIIISTTNLDTLLRITIIQISIFSTSLFDGLRYNVHNFALNLPLFSDYVASVTNAGVAFLLEEDENPVQKYLEHKGVNKTIDKEFFYTSFKKEVIHNLLQKYVGSN